MRQARQLILAVLLVASGCTPAPDPRDRAAAPRIEHDVRVLADDAMAGRLTGSAGFERAAAYVASRMRQAGLEPGTVAGSLQDVPLWRTTNLDAALVINRAQRQHVLRFRDDVLPALGVPGACTPGARMPIEATPGVGAPAADARTVDITAPAVFVGFGVHAPALGHDDVAGVDLQGKIAVLLAGAPARFDAQSSAVHGVLEDKLAVLARRGAVGAVLLVTDAEQRARPWRARVADAARPALSLRVAGDDARALPVMSVRAEHAAAVLGRDPAPVVDAALAGRVAAIALPGTLTIHTRTRCEAAVSHNIVGRLPGREPALRDQPVVVGAHLDHLGTGAGVAGDRIHNGALDNALGVAVMLEAARRLAALPQRPRRPVVFVAFTGEEQGRLGSRWFVAHAPAGRPVAAINLDMPVLLAPLQDVVPVGAAHSILDRPLAQAARATGLSLAADPRPGLAMLVRSDQYSFVRAAIPAVYLAPGLGTADGVDAFDRFLTTHYHRPDDDARQPIRYTDAARLARFTAALAARIADTAQAPARHGRNASGSDAATVTTGTGPRAMARLP